MGSPIPRCSFRENVRGGELVTGWSPSGSYVPWSRLSSEVSLVIAVQHRTISSSRLMEECPFEVRIPDALRRTFSRRGPAPARENDGRRHTRYYFPQRIVVELQSTLPGREPVRRFDQVFTRNLSRGGIAFLHPQQLHPGDAVVLWLPDGRREYVVVRCRYLGENCYDVGANLPEAVGETAVRGQS